MAEERRFRVWVWNGRGSVSAVIGEGVKYEWVDSGPGQPFAGVKLWKADGRELFVCPGKYALHIDEVEPTTS